MAEQLEFDFGDIDDDDEEFEEVDTSLFRTNNEDVPPGYTLVPAWEKCDACDDYFCNIHAVHAYDCQCPPIEDWPVSPYDPVLVVRVS